MALQHAEGASTRTFSNDTHRVYERVATAFDVLKLLIVLPYGTEDEPNFADLHMVPYFSNAIMACATQDIYDLDALSSWIAKSAPGFDLGPKMRKWWATMSERKSVEKIFAEPH
jgi:hypothetical protein